MILFTQNLGTGKRGGEKTTLKIYEYFKITFNNVNPEKLAEMEGKNRHPLKHMLNSAKIAIKLNPRLIVVDISSGIRHLLASVIVKLQGNKVMTIMLGLRMAFRYENVLVRNLVRFSEWILLNISDIVLVNSKYSASFVRRKTFAKKRIVVAYPGLDLECRPITEKKAKKHKKVILFVGECTKVKGLYYLIKALGYLADTNFHLNIVGDYNTQDPYYLSIKQIIDKFQLNDKVTFRGFVDKSDLIRYYNNTDLYVMPSLFEGYGKTIAEAMCYGLPIVATKVGAIPELVEDKKNALLVEPENSVALAEAIDRLLNDNLLRNTIIENNTIKSKSLNTWLDYYRILDKDLKPLIKELS